MKKPRLAESKPILNCPFCQSKQIIKKGRRKKKYELMFKEDFF